MQVGIRYDAPEPFDYKGERDRLVAWKGRLLPIARRLDIHKVIDLEVLGDFEPKKEILVPKDHIEAMWSEYMDRVKKFVVEAKI